MIIIGIVLALVGLAYLCWLVFALAVYALPLFALCGVPPYVAHRQIDVDPSPNRRLVRHILARLQRAQESHDIWLAGSASSRPSCSPSRQCRQCSLFRSKVGLGVDVGGIERHVSEPSTDRIDIDARLKEMGGGRMANDVGTDPFSLQR